MHAVELLPPGADRYDRETWLALRRTGVTASEIAAITGCAPLGWASAFSLWADKTGILELADDPSPAMRLGTYMEPFVLGEFTMATGHEVTRAGLCAHPERLWQLATPDGVTAGGWPVEAKTSGGYDGWGEGGSGDVPPHYAAQLLWQMDVLGADRGFVACLFFPSRSVRVYELTYDGAAAAALRDAAAAFLEAVRTETPPDIDGTMATARALRGMYAVDAADTAVISRRLLLRYGAALRRRADAERDTRELENLVRAAMGTARTGFDSKTGKPVVTRSVYYTKEHVRKAAVVDRITYRRERDDDSNRG